MADTDGYYGTQRPGEMADEYNAMAFVVRQILNGRNHIAIVRIKAVTAPLGLELAGTVDVQPLVNQLDGQGKPIAHGIINDVPYIRMQGGKDAIIIDPKEGDIGLCLFCDRDSSAVQSTKDAANPGSLRRSDMADGVYLGGMLNAIPEQYVMFTEDGITIHSPKQITMSAPRIELQAEVVKVDASESATITTPIFTVNGKTHLNGDTTVDGKVDATGTVTAPNVVGTTDVKFGGKSGVAHKHSGGTINGQTGAPV